MATDLPPRPIGQKFLYIYLDTKPPTAFIYEVIGHQPMGSGLIQAEIAPVKKLDVIVTNGTATIEMPAGNIQQGVIQ